jgi:Tfp pilus assembly protein PilX
MNMLQLLPRRRTDRVTKRRDGFALPLAIVVLALLTMSLVAGFAMTTSELSTTASQRAEARAYSNAQRGLEAFLSRRKEKAGGVMFCPNCWAVNATPAIGSVAANLDGLPTVRETVTVAFPGGMAIVRATPVLVNVATGRGKYFITSTGYDSTSGIGGLAGRSSMASRTVGVFSNWNKSTINILSAWTSLTGIRKNGTGQISGIDQCGGAAKPGLSRCHSTMAKRISRSRAISRLPAVRPTIPQRPSRRSRRR